MIPFNKPFIIGNELKYIEEAVASGKLSGDGVFSRRCQKLLEDRYGFLKVLLTTSCTDALEMAAILCDIRPGDEVIVPSYTFVSTANAFVLRGAKVVFVDSCADNPNIDVSKIDAAITKNTKVIVPVHYAGVACDMEKILEIANRHNLYVVEDAAQAIDSYYIFSDGTKKALGSIGHFGAFSFHETKNIIAGEGGMLTINDSKFINRAEIIREKGTNRSAFFRNEVDKYGWVDIGSSFLPSELVSAFLFAQLEKVDEIQSKRKAIWNYYNTNLQDLKEKGKLILPKIEGYATNNAHMYYVLCSSEDERDRLIGHLKGSNVHSVFHYLSLHKSPYFYNQHLSEDLIHSNRFSDLLLRLPIFFELSLEEQVRVIRSIRDFYNMEV